MGDPKVLLESYTVAFNVSARSEISSEAQLGKNPNSKVSWLLAVLRSLRVSVSFLSSDLPPLLAAWPSHVAVQSVATSFFIVSKRVSGITVVTVSCNIIFPCAHHLCCILLVRRKSQVLFVIDLLLCGSTVEE